MARKQSSRFKRPTQVFKKCPECESPNLLHFEGEVLCTYCSWDSIEINVEARLSGLMNAKAEAETVSMPLTLGMGFGSRRSA